MQKMVKIAQQRRERFNLSPDDSVVVRCRDHNGNYRRRRFVIILRPGDRVLVRCRDNNNNRGRNG
jgi:translation initiation factor IF-1